MPHLTCCHQQTLFFSPVSPLWGLQFLNSVAALTKKDCCRGKGRIQKTVKMGFGKLGGTSGKSDFWQRDCITISCALAKTEPFRAPGFPLG